VIRDITERRMSEMELIRAKEKAEESDKLKSAFLANMSHEIRTPINGIIGFLNFLADDNLSPKRRHEYVSVVNNSSIQLVKLIDDIIDVAKIEAKQLTIRPVVFHLNEFMNELHVFFDTYLQTNNKERIALVLDDSRFIVPDAIFVDPMRLRQVLTNLIGNAIKFTEKGYIGFGYRPLPPDKLEFWVEDSGIGLPPDQLEVIFERFRQAELTNSRKYGGTGLGLTISRSLVQMMGGDIMVESTEGDGSKFSFTVSYLPVSPRDEPFLTENVEEPLSRGHTFKEMTILLVEPGAMMCRYYEKLLESTGATLIHAETVQQWIDAISQPKHIDVVLANARVFKNEYGEALRLVKSMRADLPLVLAVPERNEYYNCVINDSRCNYVIEGTADYAMLYDALKKYV
jgi:nitrogen-specific signal transduction histidine kinase